MIKQVANIANCTATIVDPTGVPARIDILIPKKAPSTDKMALTMVTILKFLNTLIADKAGKMINADTKRLPTRFMEITMMVATTIENPMLNALTLVPLLFAKSSSKVTAKTFV